MMSTPSVVFRSLFAAALLGAALTGCGDDPRPDPEPADPSAGAWRDDFVLPGVSGFGSRVEDLERAPDGTVYVAGIFEDAAGVPARNIAAWTGAAWQPLGDGLAGWVRAITLDGDGTLWAGVTEDDGSGRLAKWDGIAWTTAGTLDGGVRGLLALDGDLVVVGEFTEAGGTAAAGVARFDGADWHAVGTGTIDGSVESIARSEFGFCVAGSFSSIGGVPAENAACWDGESWGELGTGLPGGVAELVQSPQGQWFAGGTLTFIVDEQTGAYEAGIAALHEGVWRPFGGGVDNGYINEVRAIAFDGDDLLIGGCFQSVGDTDVPASFLARWSPFDGWSELAGGVVNDVGVFLPSIEGGNDLVVADDGTVWIGGLFTRAGGGPAVNVARLAPSGEVSALVGDATILGVGGFIDAVAAGPDGTVIAGGEFGFAGTTPANNLAVFDGEAWTSLGDGIDGIVRALLVRDDGAIAVAGELVVDGEPVAFAQWDGEGWELPSGAVTGVGFALVEDEDGALWLGGDLYEAGGAQVSHLARLDDAGWHAAGAFDGRVTSLVIHDGALVAGGLFAEVDGAAAAGLAIRDGATWTELGGLDGDYPYVSALASSEALGLVVAGEFEGVAGVAAADLAVWNGTAWSDLAGGVTDSQGYGFVSGLLAHGDGVFVTGGFDHAGDVAAANLAWFDGAAWHALGDGLADLAEEMVVVDDVLYVGGPFTVAGGHPSSGIAAWDFRP